MILKALRLRNIRSYVDQTIEFPLGTTLFEGDIGSGKSTILMAIEFALFGLGSERGASLLRVGAVEGAVGLTFEVDGGEHTIVRTIRRRGKGVQQGEGYLKTPEGSLHLSPTELKEKVLEILNFNEPLDPKARSLIYRYAVFTPQEEMKGILILSPDLRLQTIRKALGIEDYRVASENASGVAKAILQKSLEFGIKAEGLEELRRSLEVKEKQLAEDGGRMESLQADEGALAQRVEELKEELAKSQNEKAKIMAVNSQIPILRDRLREASEHVERALSEMLECKEKVKVLEVRVEAFNRLQTPTSKGQGELLSEIRGLEEHERRLRGLEAVVRQKISEYEEVGRRGVCPTCDREADPKEFEEKIRLKRLEEREASQNLKVAVESLNVARGLLEDLKAYEAVAKENLRDLEELQLYLRRIGELEERVEDLQRGRQGLKQALDGAEREAARLQDVLDLIASGEAELRSQEKELTSLRGELSRLEERMSEARKVVAELVEQIRLKEEQRRKAQRLREYASWLGDYFVQTLEAIERQVLMANNLEFNEGFQRWFRMLIEDPGKEARVDEAFTPIVEQDGYEQDVYYLSGGERTSLALAYRLALNSLVQRVSVGMKSNLLILDEPTDGFSKEQLSKVRDILDELACSQVILVSHEREMESFADQVFSVVKEGGESKVVPQTP